MVWPVEWSGWIRISRPAHREKHYSRQLSKISTLLSPRNTFLFLRLLILVLSVGHRFKVPSVPPPSCLWSKLQWRSEKLKVGSLLHVGLKVKTYISVCQHLQNSSRYHTHFGNKSILIYLATGTISTMYPGKRRAKSENLCRSHGACMDQRAANLGMWEWRPFMDSFNMWEASTNEKVLAYIKVRKRHLLTSASVMSKGMRTDQS